MANQRKNIVFADFNTATLMNDYMVNNSDLNIDKIYTTASVD